MPRRAVAVTALLALAACGQEPDAAIDAATAIDAGTSDGWPWGGECPADGGRSNSLRLSSCNPVVNTGCASCEKCSQLVVSEEPHLARTDCVPRGAVPIGGACSWGEPGVATGFDDCDGGGLCVDGVCKQICSAAPDTCPDDQACVLRADEFEDVEGVGVCEPRCDPLAQDCAAGEGCYLSVATGVSMCAKPKAEEGQASPGAQGDACTHLDTCEPGLGCVLVDAALDPTTNVCAELCDALDGGGPSCSDAALTCVPINGFYSDADNVAGHIGMCVDCCTFENVMICEDAAAMCQAGAQP